MLYMSILVVVPFAIRFLEERHIGEFSELGPLIRV
jgi:hypothetical protein